MLFIINKCYIFVEIIQHFAMRTKKQILFPKHQKILDQLGENIKLARKRRKLTTIQVSERAGIDRTTLYQIEKGNSKQKRFEEFQSREIDVPVLRQTFYGKASDMQPLYTAWEQIQRYVESVTGKKYDNEDTFVTVAPMNEDREEILASDEQK